MCHCFDFDLIGNLACKAHKYMKFSTRVHFVHVVALRLEVSYKKQGTSQGHNIKKKTSMCNNSCISEAMR